MRSRSPKCSKQAKQHYHSLKGIFIFNFLFLTFFSSAQLDTILQLSHFNTKDGLSSNYTGRKNAVLQDSIGNIWIGTNTSLNKFDGCSFTIYQDDRSSSHYIRGKYFTSLCLDTNGIIWAGTMENGLNRINPLANEIVNFRYTTTDSLSLPQNRIGYIFTDQYGKLWINVHRIGLCELINEEKGEFRTLDMMHGLEEQEDVDNYGNILAGAVADPSNKNIMWLASLHGICRFDTQKESFEFFNYVDYEEDIADGKLKFKHQSRNHLRSILIDEDGIIWASTWGSGIVKFNTKTYEKKLIKCIAEDVEVFSCLNSSDLFPLNDSIFLVASLTENTGFYVFNKNDETFHDLKENQPDLPTTPTHFFQDRTNNLWISTYNEGIYCLSPSKQLFQKKSLNGYIPKAIYDENANTTYAITFDGKLYTINYQNKEILETVIPNSQETQNYELYEIGQVEDGTLWLIDEDQIHLYDPQKKQFKTLNSPSWNAFQAINNSYFTNAYLDQDFNCWIGVQREGLLKINTRTQETTLYNNDPNDPHSLKHQFDPHNMYQTVSKTTLWGSTPEGLFQYDYKNGHFINHKNHLSTQIENEVLSNHQQIIEDAKGRIWLAQKLNRIACFDSKNKPEEGVKLLEASFDFPNIDIDDMIQDTQGNIWLSSSIGLTCIDTYKDTLRHFGATYGLEYLYQFSTTFDGQILVGTRNGYIQFDPKKILASEILPSVQPIIRDFKVFNQTYAQRKDAKVKLNHNENFFSFDYSTIDFLDKNPKEYRYKLEGVDEDWVYADKRTYVGYTQVQSGDYTFKLNARRTGEAWSANEARYTIHIATPFWKTWWFILGSVLLLGGIIYLIVQDRIAARKKEQALKAEFEQQIAAIEMKALRAQMNPHFLFNSLNSINYYVLKGESARASSYLENFAKLIRLILQNSKEKLIPLEQELEALQLYIQMEQLRFEDKFDFYFTIEDDLDTSFFSIPPLIIQPYVENAIWHGLFNKTTKGRLDIKVWLEEQTIFIQIKDDGIGRVAARKIAASKSKTKESLGLKLTQARMDLSKTLNAIQIAAETKNLLHEDGSAAGTEVIIQLNYGNNTP